MDVRGKLVELLNKADSDCVGTDCFEGCKFYMENDCLYKLMADNLIANGVTVQEWIPVTERLPENGDGTVLILMPNKFPHNQKEPYPKAKHDCRVRIGQYSVYSMRWYIGDMCGVGGDDPIAWLPLPEPPKGE